MDFSTSLVASLLGVGAIEEAAMHHRTLVETILFEDLISDGQGDGHANSDMGGSGEGQGGGEGEGNDEDRDEEYLLISKYSLRTQLYATIRNSPLLANLLSPSSSSRSSTVVNTLLRSSTIRSTLLLSQMIAHLKAPSQSQSLLERFVSNSEVFSQFLSLLLQVTSPVQLDGDASTSHVFEGGCDGEEGGGGGGGRRKCSYSMWMVEVIVLRLTLVEQLQTFSTLCSQLSSSPSSPSSSSSSSSSSPLPSLLRCELKDPHHNLGSRGLFLLAYQGAGLLSRGMEEGVSEMMLWSGVRGGEDKEEGVASSQQATERVQQAHTQEVAEAMTLMRGMRDTLSDPLIPTLYRNMILSTMAPYHPPSFFTLDNGSDGSDGSDGEGEGEGEADTSRSLCDEGIGGQCVTSADTLSSSSSSSVSVSSSNSISSSSGSSYNSDATDTPPSESSPTVYAGAERSKPPRRAKVAFLSFFFTRHSVGRLLAKIIAHLDTTNLDVWIISSSKSKKDDVTSYLLKAIHPDKWIYIPLDLSRAVSMVRAEAFDILAYGDVFMDSFVAHLSAIRMAPIQVAFWGHPYTSGAPSIDYFVSSDSFEPSSNRVSRVRQFSEQLVRFDSSSFLLFDPEPSTVHSPPAYLHTAGQWSGSGESGEQFEKSIGGIGAIGGPGLVSNASSDVEANAAPTTAPSGASVLELNREFYARRYSMLNWLFSVCYSVDDAKIDHAVLYRYFDGLDDTALSPDVSNRMYALVCVFFACISTYFFITHAHTALFLFLSLSLVSASIFASPCLSLSLSRAAVSPSNPLPLPLLSIFYKTDPRPPSTPYPTQ